MISDARNGHVSPGIYTEEKDVTYSVKSLGITSLGLVGETLYGPAFENVPIKDWAEFIDYFGGTSTEKFRGTGLPKYELPYIAKSYLEESNRLNVVRVLGLSGYNAGKVWVVKSDEKPVVILRSKMTYASSGTGCEEITDKTATPIVSAITVGAYKELTTSSLCTSGSLSASTKGRFSLNVTCVDGKSYTYNVSLNSGDSTYIYNVISSTPDNGTTPIYIEAVFEKNISESAVTITSVETDKYNEQEFKKWYVLSGDTIVLTSEPSDKTNVTYVNKEPNKEITLEKGKYLCYSGKTADTIDLSNFFEAYRAAQTPWIVSDAEISETGGVLTKVVKKLFKFITISDGNAANYQVKVSLQNINPINGTFDVLVRDFNDRDDAPVVLERFTKCNLVDGDANYIAHRIGTSDGGYLSKSKYILVEMADGEDLRKRVPAGFMGYPMPKYGCASAVSAGYNVDYYDTTKSKKQYFGFSNLAGIESDIFSYKGVEIYDELNPEKTTKGFHMDALLSSGNSTVEIDGKTGYAFDCVSSSSTRKYIPRLVNNAIFLNDSLYSDINTRKFTVCFYGGFDGWDVNRDYRTNGDDYKATNLKVGNEGAFRRVYTNTDLNAALNLPNTAVTSDYYAYLAGYRVFANPQDVDINLFATPGINWYKNLLLTEEAIDVIEDKEDGRGGDALYIMASPNDLDVNEMSETFADCGINSSNACTYAPWIMYYDASNKKYLSLPVTKDVVRNMAATDNNSYPWFAPAGMERGSVNCVKADFKTTLADEDTLYENRINPVKTFAQDGVKIWGNKTAYNVESPLNRINVRRLMIRVQKLVKSAAKNLIFTQYDDSLDKQFKGLVEPILSDVKANRGISDYRILTEVTPETRDQHILPVKILIKPTPALEYISISFTVYPDSVSFDE